MESLRSLRGHYSLQNFPTRNSWAAEQTSKGSWLWHFFTSSGLEPHGHSEQSPISDLKLSGATEVKAKLLLLSFQGQLNDHKDAVNFIVEQQNIVPHIHEKILSTEKRYLNFISSPGKPSLAFLPFPLVLVIILFDLWRLILTFAVHVDMEDYSTFSFLDSQDKTVVLSENMNYVTRKGMFILLNC